VAKKKPRTRGESSGCSSHYPMSGAHREGSQRREGEEGGEEGSRRKKTFHAGSFAREISVRTNSTRGTHKRKEKG